MKFKSKKSRSALLFLFLLLLSPGLRAKELSPADQKAALKGSVELLAMLHFEKPASIGKDFSESIFKKYLESLDSEKIYFLGSDVDQLQKKYADDFFPAIRRGDPSVIDAIYERYRSRAAEMVATAHEILGDRLLAPAPGAPPQFQAPDAGAASTNSPSLTPATDPSIASLIDFTRDETLTLPFKTWVRDSKEREDRLRLMIRKSLLSAEIAKENLDKQRKLLGHRYDLLAKHVKNADSGEIIGGGLTSLMHRFDPHSDYFGPTETKNFDIQMNAEQLIGVGAVLAQEDGDTLIDSIVSGGPAAADGRLKAGDKIVAVAQGEDAPVDVQEMELPDIVAIIRGKENTVVKLTVIPKAKPTERTSIALTRRAVELENLEASAKVVKAPGSTDLVGVITLGSFYENCSAHVAKLIADLKTQKVSAIILDLRGDGGGLLSEAVNLTHLFIKSGPVVLARFHDSDGGPDAQEILPSKEEDVKSTMIYDGPLVVMVDELTASASEIVAAALQDYHRAIVVGSKTHGKGTIQRPVNIKAVQPVEDDAGTIHVTNGEFFRITGQTTQYGGVVSDIILPSFFEGLKTEEKYMDNALKPRQVDPVAFVPFDMGVYSLAQLRKDSGARVASNAEFSYLNGLLTDRSKLPDDEVVYFLSKEKREKEINDAEAKEKAQEAVRKKLAPGLEVVKELVINEADRKVSTDKPEKTSFDYLSEAQLAETVNITEDWLAERVDAAKAGSAKVTAQEPVPVSSVTRSPLP